MGLPIWQISKLNFTEETRANFSIFYDKILDTLADCQNVLCGGKGICAVTEAITTETFVSTWDGQDFTQFWDRSGVCFCEGEACAEEPDLGCKCTGTAGCCCNNDNTCDYAHICQPSTDITPNKCLYRDGAAAECGSYGEFIQCSAMDGVVYSTCGSGHKADCGTYSGMCPGGMYSGIRCGYKGLGTTDNIGQWRCGGAGSSMSCSSSSPFLLGICGSGGNQDCQTKCVGYAGILCGTVENVDVDQDECYWETQYNWGKVISCDSGYVGTGYCGSGRYRDCGGKLAKLRCCPLKYTNTTYPTSPSV